jgi:hypothetical protein
MTTLRLAQAQLGYATQVKLSYEAEASDTYVGFKCVLIKVFVLYLKILLHVCCFWAKTLPGFGYLAS